MAKTQLPLCILLLIATVFTGTLQGQETKWPAVFNPFQVRTIFLEIDPTIWEDIKRDINYSNCSTPGCDPALNIRAECLMWDDLNTNKLAVQIRRKSDPALPDEANPVKVSLKIDVNEYVAGQEWMGLKKISLENGNGGNGVLREAMGMQLHRLASAGGMYDYEAGYSAWVRLVVNDSYVGLYASPEQRDKQFLRNRGMYNPGASWLYEVNAGTFLDTTVSTTNSPTYDFLCFSPFRNACSQPNTPSVATAMERELQDRVDMKGMLTMAAIEAFMANRDGLFTKDGKNSFMVDMLPSTVQKRRYFPWDLDAVLSSTTWDIYTGGGGGTRPYQTQILAHNWFRQVYRHTFTDLLNGPLSINDLTAFLNALEPVLSPYLDEDPNELGGAEDFHSLRQYFTNRIANVRGQVGAVTGWPLFSQNGGEIVSGFQAALSHTNAAGVIYYTLNGTDPRGLAGITNGAAYSSPLTLTTTTHIMARVKSGTNWSALREATFNVANHASAMRVTEIMYRPRDVAAEGDDEAFEFIELKNTGSTAVNLSKCFFEGIDFTFKPGTVVAPNGFIVLVKNPSQFPRRFPSVTYHGSYFGSLSNQGEKLRLKNSDGNTILSVEYNNGGSWPLGADGMGYSLVNINLNGDPDDPANWRASTALHGSPGADDPTAPYQVGLVINEVLAHTDAPEEDAIEIYNPTTNNINIGGWYLSDEIDKTNTARPLLKKYKIAGGTIVPAGGYKVFYEGSFNPITPTTNALINFALSKHGEAVYLSSADSAGNLTGHVIGVQFGASDNPVSFGRHQTSKNADFVAMERYSFGVTNPTSKEHFRTGTGVLNPGPRIGPVVISEIMYNPAAGGTEFVELYNLAGTNVDLAGWVLNGAAGLTFPPATIIEPGGFLVVIGSTNVSVTDFRASNNVPSSVPILSHNFDLKNEGELLQLSKANEDPLGPPILVDAVRFNDKAPWPTEADGEGPSLERVSLSSYGNEPLTWRTISNGGSPGRFDPGTNRVAIISGSSWSYYSGGNNLGTVWAGTNYSDSGWLTGDGPIGHGEPFIRTTLPNYNVAPRPLTTYFRKTFTISDPVAAINSLTLAANYDDGFVAYLNGHEVARRSLAEGPITFTTAASAHPAGVYETINLTSEISRLVRGRNVIAIELHQENTSVASAAWDAALTYAVNTPSVTSQPQDQAVIAGTSATFDVVASGAAPFKYQWLFNGTAIPGATSSSHTVENVQPSNVGAYSAVIFDGTGLEVVSSAAALSISGEASLTITQQPENVTVIAGSNATFTVGAAGTSPISYQWQHNAGNIPGATGSSYTVVNAQPGHAGSYSVEVTNPAGTLTSSSATLTVIVPPLIVTQPQSRTVALDSNVTFNVITTGTAPLAYQWLFNGEVLPGATGSTFTRSPVQTNDAGVYAVEVSNAGGTILSSNALLTVSFDSTPPVVKIMTPAAGARLTDNSVTNYITQIAGTVSDNVHVAEISYSLNGNAFVPLAGASWVAYPAILPGLNTLVVKARDDFGNETVVTRNFTYVVLSKLTVNVRGLGHFTPATLNGADLEIGKLYKLTAVVGAGTNYVFTNWTQVVNGSTNLFASTNVINFPMQSNLVLNANFITNPLIRFAGIYNGLFHEADAVRHHSAGFVTVKVNKTFSYSGKLLVDGNSVSFSGKLNVAATAEKVISRNLIAKSNLLLNLQVDLANANDTVFGSVSDPIAGWTSPLLADRRWWTTNSEQQATSFTNAYTMILPGFVNNASGPEGTSFIPLSIDSLGKSRIVAGRMSDDNMPRQTTVLSKNGDWPFFSQLYLSTNRLVTNGLTIKRVNEYHGLLMGWLTFPTNSQGNRHPVGTVDWIKSGNRPIGNWPGGFTNQVSAAGSRHLPPLLGITPRLYNFTNASLVASSGGLPQSITNNVILSTTHTLTVTAPATNKFVASLAAKTGVIKGTLTNAVTGSTTLRWYGVMLQDQNYGAGYFVNSGTANTSGKISVTPKN